MGRPAYGGVPPLEDMDPREAIDFLIAAALSGDEDSFDNAVDALLACDAEDRYFSFQLPTLGVASRRGDDVYRAARRLWAAVEGSES